MADRLTRFSRPYIFLFPFFYSGLVWQSKIKQSSKNFLDLISGRRSTTLKQTNLFSLCVCSSLVFNFLILDEKKKGVFVIDLKTVEWINKSKPTQMIHFFLVFFKCNRFYIREKHGAHTLCQHTQHVLFQCLVVVFFFFYNN